MTHSQNIKTKQALSKVRRKIDQERAKESQKPVSEGTWSRIEQILEKLNLPLEPAMVVHILVAIQRELEDET